MNNLNPVKILLIFIILIQPFAGYGGDTLSGKYPRAVLVQLRSEHNRIEALTKDGNYKAIKEVKKDAVEVKKRMILDFTTNYHYSPVYYYIGTNADFIKKKVFDGILMNADGSAVNKPVINSNSNDYVIVYYGYYIYQPKPTNVVKDSSRYIYDPETPPGKGLVVLNAQFQQIDYFYKLGYDISPLRPRKKNRKPKTAIKKPTQDALKGTRSS